MSKKEILENNEAVVTDTEDVHVSQLSRWHESTEPRTSASDVLVDAIEVEPKEETFFEALQRIATSTTTDQNDDNIVEHLLVNKLGIAGARVVAGLVYIPPFNTAPVSMQKIAVFITQRAGQK